MRQLLIASSLGIILAAGAVAAPLAAKTRTAIVRNANPDNPKAVILQSVKVPANAEWLLLSGIVPHPLDPEKAKTTPPTTVADYGDTYVQTKSVLARIEGALTRQGYGMSDVVRLTVYLVADPATGTMDFDGMNRAYREYFGIGRNPYIVARSTVEVKALAAPGLLVEIEATAAKAR